MFMIKFILRNFLEVVFNVFILYGIEFEWIFDLSVFVYFLGDKDVFKYIIFFNWLLVIFIRSNVYCIEGYGVIYGFFFLGEIKIIKNVKYVLRFYCNILFVGKIIDKGYIVVVDKYFCVIFS